MRNLLACAMVLTSSLLTSHSSDAQGAGFSLRFHGNGVGDIDRVKIHIDDPTDSDPGPPVDVGATDFTLEFWMKSSASENTAGGVTCGDNINWINGNIIFDRDRFNQDRKFGISLADGRIVFGVSGNGTGDHTICNDSAADLRDGQWHHIAVQRRRADGQPDAGWMWLYVDGVLEAQADGPDGDISYPDDGVPGDFCSGPCTNSDPYLVIGAEKHDAGSAFPPFSGWIDDVRLSNTLRYTSNFSRPSRPFTPDTDTAALYHFDEGSGNTINDSSGASGGPSQGTRNFGGSPAGPEWSTDTPRFGGLPALAPVPVLTDLDRPVAITNAGDGSNRLFITLQGGRILTYNGAQVTTFLDISVLVSSGGEEGLLSAAFHPNYPATPHFYVFYTNNDGDLVIARYSVSGDPDVADPNSAQIILTIPHPVASNHNGGQLQFGPDGYLYIGTGDGGGGGDAPNNAQNFAVLLGKVLRIDVDGGPPYAIPPDNPFVEDPDDPATRAEIWALGFRNPWRFGFDRITGDLFLGDVGQNSREEIDFQPAISQGGENYGWRRMEGTACFNPSSDCNDGTLTLPILEYTHSLGCSITGGYRYRGTQQPQLTGVYLYGDYCAGRIWGATQNGQGGWMTTELANTELLISAFGENEAGELYLAHHGSQGAIYHISASTSQRDLTGQIGQLTKVTKRDRDKLTFVVTVQNVGDLPITAKSQVQVYLSADDTLDVSDMLVLNKQVKAKQLAPGGIVTTKGNASVARPSQGQFLILKVDADNMVVESDEGNNLFILQIP